MARKKRKSSGRRKTTRRRSRVGAVPTTGVVGSVISYGLGIPAGAYASSFIANKITAQPLLKASAQALLGIGTIWANKKWLKMPILDAVGGGMIAGGGMTVAQELLPAVTDGMNLAGLESAAPIYSMSGLDSPAPTNSYIGETLRLRVR